MDNEAARWLKNRVFALGTNQIGFARRVKLESQTIRNYWKTGLPGRLPEPIAMVLMEHLGVNREGMERLQSGKAPLPRQIKSVEEMLTSPPDRPQSMRTTDPINIPVFAAVPAGSMDESLNLYEFFDSSRMSDEYLDRRLVGITDPAAFAFRIRGSCMLPTLKDGDLVVASPKASGEQGSKIRNGHVCLIRFTAESDYPAMQTVKRYHDNGDGTIRLYPDNQLGGFEPIIVPKSEIAAIFRLVKFVSDL